MKWTDEIHQKQTTNNHTNTAATTFMKAHIYTLNWMNQLHLKSKGVIDCIKHCLKALKQCASAIVEYFHSVMAEDLLLT